MTLGMFVYLKIVLIQSLEISHLCMVDALSVFVNIYEATCDTFPRGMFACIDLIWCATCYTLLNI